MNYTRALDYIHSLSKFGSKPGLDRVSRLVSLANNPQNDLKFIHIAGTSGKGSTASFCASILKIAGLKAGLYTSPFVIDFRERFQINSDLISKEDFCRLCEKLIPLAEKLNSEGVIITEFEFNTALAFTYFKEQKCDVVCLEVGMGGRFDATNIISSPLVSVITSIGLDHTDYLGGTVSKIAFEKCGIIKENSNVVSYPLQKPEALEVIENSCKERNCNLTVPYLKNIEIIKETIDGSEFFYNGQKYALNMAGRHQIYNAVTAICAINALGLGISYEAIFEGLNAVKCPARLEVISQNPLVLIDGAHNSDKVLALYEHIRDYKGKIVSICGMLKDKEYEKSASLIAPLCKSIITITPNSPRALSAKEMAEVSKKYCKDCACAPTIKEAVSLALAKLNKDDMLLCWGSLYTAGELKEEFKRVL